MDPRIPHRCAHCGAPASLMCSRCQKVAYCCAGCQAADWPKHKPACRAAVAAEAAEAKAVAVPLVGKALLETLVIGKLYRFTYKRKDGGTSTAEGIWTGVTSNGWWDIGDAGGAPHLVLSVEETEKTDRIIGDAVRDFQNGDITIEAILTNSGISVDELKAYAAAHNFPEALELLNKLPAARRRQRKRSRRRQQRQQRQRQSRRR